MATIRGHNTIQEQTRLANARRNSEKTNTELRKQKPVTVNWPAAIQRLHAIFAELGYPQDEE